MYTEGFVVARVFFVSFSLIVIALSTAIPMYGYYRRRWKGAAIGCLMEPIVCLVVIGIVLLSILGYKKLGVRDKTFFHVSDEPQAEHLDNYRFASALLRSIAPGLTTFDAMSNYSFYEGGTVDIPVVREISPDMEKFISGCDNFWIYYTGGVIGEGNANRLITLPQARNRLLGLHLYVANAKGFLHWGYNYYYDVLTHGIRDPFTDPCFYLGSPGTSYLVYPAANGKPVPSQRLKVTREAFADYALFKAVEKKIGRAAVLSMIEETVGKVGVDVAVPETGLLRLRDRALDLL